MLDTEEVMTWVRAYGLVAVFFGTALDHTGVPLFLVAGICLGSTADIAPWKILAVAWLGSFVGDVVLYLLGRYVFVYAFVAGRIAERHADRLKRARNYVQTYGGWGMVFGRFVSVLGKYVPAVAGIFKYDYDRMLMASALGSALYVGAFAGVTLAFQEAVLDVQGAYAEAWIALFAVSAVILLFGYWAHRRFM